MIQLLLNLLHNPVIAGVMDVGAALGVAFVFQRMLHSEYMLQFIFASHKRFNDLVESWKLGEDKEEVWKECDLKRRAVEAEALKALATKSLANAMLFLALAIMLYVAFSKGNGPG